MSAPVLPRSLKTNPQLERWVRFNADRTVTVFSGKVELGQGIVTAIAQIAAEELDVSLARLAIVPGDTRCSPDEWYTAGSQSIEVGGAAMRLACAEVRHLFVEAAARRFETTMRRGSGSSSRKAIGSSEMLPLVMTKAMKLSRRRR